MCANPRRFLSVPFTFTESTSAPVLPTESKAVQTDGRRTDKRAEINLLETLTKVSRAAKLRSTYNLSEEKIYRKGTNKTEINMLSPRLKKLLTWTPNLKLMEDILVVNFYDKL